MSDQARVSRAFALGSILVVAVLASVFLRSPWGHEVDGDKEPTERLARDRTDMSVPMVPADRAPAARVPAGHQGGPSPSQAKARGKRIEIRVIDQKGGAIASSSVTSEDAARVAGDRARTSRFEVDPTLERVVFEIDALGYVPRTYAVDPSTVEEEQALDVVLEAGVIVSGTVVGPSGAAISGVLVSLSPSTGGLGGAPQLMRLCETDSSGRFIVDALRPSIHRLIFEHPDFPGIQETVDVTDGQRAVLTVTLCAGEAIKGSIQALSSSEFGSVEVQARYIGSSRAVPISEAVQTARCDGRGSFELVGLAQDSDYEIRVHWQAGSSRVLVAGPVVAHTGAAPIDIALEVRNVDLEVLSQSTGEAVKGPDFRLFSQGQGPRRSFKLIERASGNGGEIFVIGPLESVLPDRLILEVSADGYAPTRVAASLAPDNSTLIVGRVLLTPLHRIDVSVLEAGSSHPVQEAEVFAVFGEVFSNDVNALMQSTQPKPLGEFVADRRARVTTDSEGNATLFAPPSIIVHLVARHPDSGWSEPVDVTPNEGVPCVLFLEFGGTVEVRAVNSTGGVAGPRTVESIYDVGEAVSQICFGGPSIQRLTTDDDAVAVFENLPPGKHHFRILVDGCAYEDHIWRALDVSAGSFDELVLLFEEAFPVAGSVLLGEELLESARVTMIEEQRYGAEPELGYLDWMNLTTLVRDGRVATTNFEGRFEFAPGLPQGRYRARVYHPRLVGAHETVLEVSDAIDDLVIRMASREIVGRVKDTSGHPIGGASVFLARSANQEAALEDLLSLERVDVRTGWEAITRTEPDGSFVVGGLLPGREYALCATADGFTTVSRTVTAEDGRTQVDPLILDASGTLVVELVGGTPSSRRALNGLRATQLDGGRREETLTWRSRSSFWVQSEGLRFPHLASGSWRFEFMSHGSKPAPFVAQVTAGEVTHVQADLDQ